VIYTYVESGERGAGNVKKSSGDKKSKTPGPKKTDDMSGAKNEGKSKGYICACM
jgi:hypothetical protein